jgi:hypothetical protein
MQALTFWKRVTMDETDFLSALIQLLHAEGVRYAVVGGQAVNAYADPLVSLDLDLVVATEDLGRVELLLKEHFKVERFPHSLNASRPGSDLRVQVQMDPRYAAFVQRASLHEVLGLTLPVADVRDVLQGKIWAAQDTTRRPSKRQKDLADIARLIERYPELRPSVPQDILERLI